MKAFLFFTLLVSPIIVFAQAEAVAKFEQYPPVDKVAKDFKALLQRPVVDFKPSFQVIKTDTVLIYKGFIFSEASEKVPILIYKPVNTTAKSFPVVICLHGTGGNKEEESVKDLLYQFSKIGIMGVSIDARYHGERVPGGANKAQQYVEAILTEWKNKDSKSRQYPFYYDTVYDLWRLTDYLITRPDVQASRIGMMGISMGGIETWMAASVDKRIKVAVPVIAAQSFRWSLANDRWQSRANTILKAHEQAAKDLGDSTVNKENVRVFWAKLLPGITGGFDCPSMLRLFAPRPLLLLNNEKDQNCPLGGAEVAFDAAKKAYKMKNAAEKLKIDVTPNEPHRFLRRHRQMALNWFEKWL